MNIRRGTLIQVNMGADKGRVGTVIGTLASQWSQLATLVVFFEDNKLDMCVLPEMVNVLSIPDDSDVVFLSDREMELLFASE